MSVMIARSTTGQTLDESNIDLSVVIDSDLEDDLHHDWDHRASLDVAIKNEKDYDRKLTLLEARSTWTDQDVEKIIDYLKKKGMVAWMKEYVLRLRVPVYKLMFALKIMPPKGWREKSLTDIQLFPALKVAITRLLRKREKLPQHNTVDDVVRLLRNSRRIIILSGAGISVSCGIPDFRSRDGLYAMLENQNEYDIDDPQDMFDIRYFRKQPQAFYSFARQIYPSNFKPSLSHRFIKGLEDKGKLLRNYTQNIDTLETLTGIRNVLQCHGSFATASCVRCRHKIPGEEIKESIMAQSVAYCKICSAIPKKRGRPRKNVPKRPQWDFGDTESEQPRSGGIMKPDITFFGEKLTDEFDRLLFEDRDSVDLLLVIGTSLKVTPVSDVLTHIPHSVPVIVINKTPIKHVNPDVLLLGDADAIVRHLMNKLDWPIPEEHKCTAVSSLTPTSSLPQPDPKAPTSLSGKGYPHVWVFEGAEGIWNPNIPLNVALRGEEHNVSAAMKRDMKTEGSTATGKKRRIS